jgi:hypothetical protein
VASLHSTPSDGFRNFNLNWNGVMTICKLAKGNEFQR